MNKIIRNGLSVGVLFLLVPLISGCNTESLANDLQNAAGSYQDDQATANQAEDSSSKSSGACEAPEQQQHMLDLINQARAEARSCGEEAYQAVPALTWDCQLRDAAIAHTEDMTTHNFFSHSGSDGLRAGDRISATGYNWRYYGENLAAGFIFAQDALNGLLDSPGHCKNIMNANVTEFGSNVMFVENLDYQSYWTHVFAAPQ